MGQYRTRYYGQARYYEWTHTTMVMALMAILAVAWTWATVRGKKYTHDAADSVFWAEPQAAPETPPEWERGAVAAPLFSATASPFTYNQFLHALMLVESGGNYMAVGDDSGSRGPYQIGFGYWSDGGGNWNGWEWDVWNPVLCEPIMRRYWNRYCPGAIQQQNWERLARTHNGGPDGATEAATVPFWNKVRKELEKQKLYRFSRTGD